MICICPSLGYPSWLPAVAVSQAVGSGWGYVLVLGFLVFDGLTSTLQEKLFKASEDLDIGGDEGRQE